jgi:hypothetical protein
MNLTKEDWMEIYAALKAQARWVEEVQGDEEWTLHLREIMGVIGEDGKSMAQDGQHKVFVIVEGGLVQDVLTTLPNDVELSIIDHDTDGMDDEGYEIYKGLVKEMDETNNLRSWYWRDV